MVDQRFVDTLDKIWSVMHYTLFKINQTHVSLLTLVGVIIIITIGIKGAKYFKRYVSSLPNRRSLHLKQETATLFSILGYYFILVTTFLMAIGYAGIDLTSFTIIMSALSVGIGFGLQAILSNFVSGIVLLFESSLKIGDRVEVGNGVTGTVTDIKMRYTNVLTFDNVDVLVPNKFFIENMVTNWTHSDVTRRLKVPFGVSYSTDADTVDNVIIPAIMNLELDFVKDDPDKMPKCVMTSLGDSSVNFELWIWVRVGVPNQVPPSITLNDILRTIYKALKDNNIEIPFPQQDVHLISTPTSMNTNKDINIG